MDGFPENVVPQDSQNLIVFLVNKEIYHEASRIYYLHNNFDFRCLDGRHHYKQSLANGVAFVQDRPQHTLEHLKYMRLAVGYSGSYRFEDLWIFAKVVMRFWDVCLGPISISEKKSWMEYFRIAPRVEWFCMQHLYNLKESQIWQQSFYTNAIRLPHPLNRPPISVKTYESLCSADGDASRRRMSTVSDPGVQTTATAVCKGIHSKTIKTGQRN